MKEEHNLQIQKFFDDFLLLHFHFHFHWFKAWLVARITSRSCITLKFSRIFLSTDSSFSCWESPSLVVSPLVKPSSRALRILLYSTSLAFVRCKSRASLFLSCRSIACGSVAGIFSVICVQNQNHITSIVELKLK